jgi:hypothetical protein
MRGPIVSDIEERACGCGFLGWPTWKRERMERKRRLSSARPKGKRERSEQASAERASRPPGYTGKAFLFSFFFSFLN